jgi:hypothetical protein
MSSGTALTPIGEGPSNLLAAIVVLAKDPSVDVEKLSALMMMQERMEARAAVAAFNRDFARMAPHLPKVKKNGEVWYPINKNQPDGPKRKAFNYATWEDVDDAIRPILLEYGFFLTFNTTQRAGDGGGVVVHGRLSHFEGHTETADFALPLDTSGGKSNLQGYASSTSFGQRYTAKMLLNIVFEGEDDDGVKGGMSFLSDEQVFDLHDLMRQTKTSEEAFLRYMGYAGGGIHDLTEIEARDFAKLKNALLTKVKQS